ncbi:hypothetical protein K502DRAFT_324190, partial [Neoconidiobolus thromboides FSU 785]
MNFSKEELSEEEDTHMGFGREELNDDDVRVSFSNNNIIEKKEEGNYQPSFKKNKVMNKKKFQQPKQVDRDFGAFLKHDKKKTVLKMMEKMGFNKNEGLGKDGTGRIAPIEVKVRNKNMGLGFNGFRERVDGNFNEEEEVEEVKERKPNKIQKPTVMYPNLDHIIKSVEQRRENNEKDENLIKDVNVILEVTKKELLDIYNEKKLLNLQLNNYQLEKENVYNFIHKYQVEMNYFDQIKSFILNINGMEGSSNSDDELSITNKKLSELNEILLSIINSNSEYLNAIYVKIQFIAVNIIQDKFKLYLKQFNFDQMDPNLLQLFELILNYPLLFKVNNSNTVENENGNEDSNNIYSPFDYLVFNEFLPVLKQTISDKMDQRMDQDDKIIQFLQGWEPLFCASIFQIIMNDIIVPNLISNLNFKFAIHYYLFPWLPLLSNKDKHKRHNEWPKELIKAVKKWIAKAIEKWEPADKKEDLLQLILPWREILDRSTFDKLMVNNLIPRLEDILKRHFDINPSEQDLNLFNLLLSFKDIISFNDFDSLLSAAIFKKWLSTLDMWLDMDPPMMELFRWYTYWKSLVPKDIIKEGQQVNDKLRVGLLTILNYMNNN